jgi:hypothetical protein
MFKKTQVLQRISPLYEIKRPHKGTLYYEYREFAKWELLSKNIKNFIKMT